LVTVGHIENTGLGNRAVVQGHGSTWFTIFQVDNLIRRLVPRKIASEEHSLVEGCSRGRSMSGVQQELVAVLGFGLQMDDQQLLLVAVVLREVSRLDSYFQLSV
jgi:hypothetical protein